MGPRSTAPFIDLVITECQRQYGAGDDIDFPIGGILQYMKLNAAQREELLASLADMSEYLRKTFSGLSPEQTRVPGPAGAFSPVEHVWHLADLEREGFGERIQRLLSESEPQLLNFDGAKIAAERNYRSLSFEEGLSTFTQARRRNIAMLQAIDSQAWMRSGTQEGIGKVSLCDIPGLMSQHDSAHKIEIEAWQTN